jgi:anti-sigma factor RsiW
MAEPGRTPPAPHYDVAGYVLGTLTTAETRAFEAHLAGCSECRAEVAELGTLPALLRTAAATPPPALHRRTFDAVTTARQGPARQGPVRPPAGGPPGQVPRIGRPGPPPSGPPGGPQLWDAPTPPAGLPANVTPLRPHRSKAVRWLAAAAAGVLVAAAVGIGAVIVTGGGDATTIALSAGDVGSGSGRAEVSLVDGGRRIELSVSGLPANPPGTYYECWFVGPGDTAEAPNRVSAGTFTVGADGTATVTMVSAADAARFPKMGVTLEPDDGNPARTGPKYLVSP